MSNNWILGFTSFSKKTIFVFIFHWKKSLTSELLQLSRQAPSFEMIPSRHEKKFSSSRNFSFFESYPGKILTISFNQYFWIGITFTMSTDTLVPLKVNPMKKITNLVSHTFKRAKKHTQLNSRASLFDAILYIFDRIQTKRNFTSASINKWIVNVLCHYVEEIPRLQVFSSLSKSLRIINIIYKS